MAKAMSDMRLIESNQLLFYVLVGEDGIATIGGKTKDWEWVAQSMRRLAEEADRRAAEAAVGEVAAAAGKPPCTCASRKWGDPMCPALIAEARRLREKGEG